MKNNILHCLLKEKPTTGEDEYSSSFCNGYASAVMIVATVEEPVCQWSIHDDSSEFHSSCGQSFYFNDYEVGINEFQFNFCPYCGKQAIEKILGDDDE